MLCFGDGDVHVLLLGLEVSLGDVMRLIFGHCDVVLFYLGFSDVVRLLDGLVGVVGDGDVVWDLKVTGREGERKGGLENASVGDVDLMMMSFRCHLRVMG